MKNKILSTSQHKETEKPGQNKLVDSIKSNSLFHQSNILWLFLFVIIALLYDLLIWQASDSFVNEPVTTVSVSIKPNPMKDKIHNLVKGYPIENMVRYISKKDPRTAAYLVSVAKKESNWGKRSPKKDGQECYNYWGYRGPENPNRSGYSCFKNPKEAIRIVGERFDELIAQNIDEPEEMVVWKCGWDCSTHNPVSVDKWIKDVSLYYNKLF